MYSLCFISSFRSHSRRYSHPHSSSCKHAHSNLPSPTSRLPFPISPSPHLPMVPQKKKKKQCIEGNQSQIYSHPQSLIDTPTNNNRCSGWLCRTQLSTSVHTTSTQTVTRSAYDRALRHWQRQDDGKRQFFFFSFFPPLILKGTLPRKTVQSNQPPKSRRLMYNFKPDTHPLKRKKEKQTTKTENTHTHTQSALLPKNPPASNPVFRPALSSHRQYHHGTKIRGR